MSIGDRLVGEGEPCFIIAEAGVNHNGDIGLAKKLIDAAREAGADAVKFQSFITEEVVTPGAQKAEYQKETTGADESQFDMLKRLELTENNFTELSNYARNKGLIFLATPFDERSVDLLDELDVPAFKIASGEITNVPLLRHIARKKKPVILSTGMATLDEIGESLEIIRQEKLTEIILLHCVSCYPAQIADMNLRAMQTLKLTFGLPVGLSDHTTGVTIPVAAAALGLELWTGNHPAREP
ncbi:MAG: N-acetylneuraminate synthase family protein [Chloroflexi bacterium]|nr:N-acetylneuraminate synthase family protein [Chloroflexota bacterium]